MLEWYVFNYDVNKQKMEKYNIFNHRTFVAYITEAIKEGLNKELFGKRLQSELRYYFWSKAEWEIIIAPWCGNKNTDKMKIDVYDQVMLNFNILVDYIWDNKTILLGNGEE